MAKGTRRQSRGRGYRKSRRHSSRRAGKSRVSNRRGRKHSSYRRAKGRGRRSTRRLQQRGGGRWTLPFARDRTGNAEKRQWLEQFELAVAERSRGRQLPAPVRGWLAELANQWWEVAEKRAKESNDGRPVKDRVDGLRDGWLLEQAQRSGVSDVVANVLETEKPEKKERKRIQESLLKYEYGRIAEEEFRNQLPVQLMQRVNEKLQAEREMKEAKLGAFEKKKARVDEGVKLRIRFQEAKHKMEEAVREAEQTDGSGEAGADNKREAWQRAWDAASALESAAEALQGLKGSSAELGDKEPIKREVAEARHEAKRAQQKSPAGIWKHRNDGNAGSVAKAQELKKAEVHRKEELFWDAAEAAHRSFETDLPGAHRGIHAWEEFKNAVKHGHLPRSADDRWQRVKALENGWMAEKEEARNNDR